jgi:hypothetical protein
MGQGVGCSEPLSELKSCELCVKLFLLPTSPGIRKIMLMLKTRSIGGNHKQESPRREGRGSSPFTVIGVPACTVPRT